MLTVARFISGIAHLLTVARFISGTAHLLTVARFISRIAHLLTVARFISGIAHKLLPLSQAPAKVRIKRGFLGSLSKAVDDIRLMNFKDSDEDFQQIRTSNAANMKHMKEAARRYQEIVDTEHSELDKNSLLVLYSL